MALGLFGSLAFASSYALSAFEIVELELVLRETVSRYLPVAAADPPLPSRSHPLR